MTKFSQVILYLFICTLQFLLILLKVKTVSCMYCNMPFLLFIFCKIFIKIGSIFNNFFILNCCQDCLQRDPPRMTLPSMIRTCWSLSDRVCSWSKPSAWSSSCWMVCRKIQPRRLKETVWPLPRRPTNEKHLKKSSKQDIKRKEPSQFPVWLSL